MEQSVKSVYIKMCGQRRCWMRQNDKYVQLVVEKDPYNLLITEYFINRFKGTFSILMDHPRSNFWER